MPPTQVVYTERAAPSYEIGRTRCRRPAPERRLNARRAGAHHGVAAW